VDEAAGSTTKHCFVGRAGMRRGPSLGEGWPDRLKARRTQSHPGHRLTYRIGRLRAPPCGALFICGAGCVDEAAGSTTKHCFVGRAGMRRGPSLGEGWPDRPKARRTHWLRPVALQLNLTMHRDQVSLRRNMTRCRHVVPPLSEARTSCRPVRGAFYYLWCGVRGRTHWFVRKALRDGSD
jgi:hypothetical protein